MRRLIIITSTFVPIMLFVFITQQLFPDIAVAAQLADEQGQKMAATRSSNAILAAAAPITPTITKTVDLTSAVIGSPVEYTILLASSDNVTLTNASIIDSLPVELDYISGTLVVNGGGSFGITNDVITWTGSITAGESVSLQFGALITDTLMGSGWLTNTVAATADGGFTLSDTVSINYSEAITYQTFLPLLFKPLPAPTLLSVSIPSSSDNNASSQATASWTAVAEATGYELEESATADFANPTVYSAGTATSFDLSHTSTWANKYYYRVRALGNVNSGYSNALAQSYIYYDSFSDPSSGWAIRRSDLDDADNETYYENGKFKMKVHGRWDSMIAGPLTPVPTTWNSYAIDTRVILEDGIDNLHSYGIVFGGDKVSDPCPNSNFTSCFNHYYRINVIWFGADSGKLRVSLKRIDYHDYVTDKDVGETLMPHTDISVPDPNGWNNWNVEVKSNGQIRVFLNGKLITDVIDTNYVGGGYYFGTFASSDEYLGTAAWYDYYRVRPLP